mmetsp:Transcript_40514/g.95143  ORF Transcript_40514/g.95143 Transcript_40514/m.95143 type:complete len:88 (-) Transcript_40514:442-705(-)
MTKGMLSFLLLLVVHILCIIHTPTEITKSKFGCKVEKVWHQSFENKVYLQGWFHSSGSHDASPYATITSARSVAGTDTMFFKSRTSI